MSRAARLPYDVIRQPTQPLALGSIIPLLQCRTRWIGRRSSSQSRIIQMAHLSQNRQILGQRQSVAL